jgi:hypothetical protein
MEIMLKLTVCIVRICCDQCFAGYIAGWDRPIVQWMESNPSVKLTDAEANRTNTVNVTARQKHALWAAACHSHAPVQTRYSVKEIIDIRTLMTQWRARNHDSYHSDRKTWITKQLSYCMFRRGGRNQLEDLSVDGRTVSNWILRT